MFCPNCGNKLNENEQFCNNCGNRISDIKEPVVDTNSAQLQSSVLDSSFNTLGSTVATTTASGIGITKIVVAIVSVLIIIVGTVIGVNYFSNDKNNNTDEKNSQENASTDSNSNSGSQVDYSTYTVDIPRSDRTLDYYWNINTATFDKTKFDGRISVFGTIMNTKLTGKTLKDAGFKFVTWTSEDSDAKEQTTLDYDLENEYYSDYGLLYINDKVYPTYNYNVTVDFVNYKGISSVYDDSTELYFYQTTIYQDKNNVVVPYIENIDYSELTIDDIIDNLGAPTYVEGRTSKLEDAGKSFGSTTFNYIYVYDDYIFKFNFMHYDNTGFSITGLTYMGNQKFSQPVEVFNWDTYENDIYETYSKFLDEQQDEYLTSIGQK